MLQKWRAHGAMTYAGYILGFPADTKESILRDIEIIKRELPLDILEFFFLTPLPGSEDHKTLLKKGVWMDPDINKYDLDHRVVASCEDVGRRMGGGLPRGLGFLLHARAHPHDPEARRPIPNGRPKPITSTIMWFKLMIEQEGVHPLEGGAFRLKYRRDRRLSLPIESPFVFYPRYWGGIAVKAWKYLELLFEHAALLKEVLDAPDR